MDHDKAIVLGGRSVMGLAAAAAAIASMSAMAGQPTAYPHGPRRKRRARDWTNEGVRAGKQYRLKGIRP